MDEEGANDPWPEIEKRYAALFTNRKGNVAKPLRRLGKGPLPDVMPGAALVKYHFPSMTGRTFWMQRLSASPVSAISPYFLLVCDMLALLTVKPYPCSDLFVGRQLLRIKFTLVVVCVDYEGEPGSVHCQTGFENGVRIPNVWWTRRGSNPRTSRMRTVRSPS